MPGTHPIQMRSARPEASWPGHPRSRVKHTAPRRGTAHKARDKRGGEHTATGTGIHAARGFARSGRPLFQVTVAGTGARRANRSSSANPTGLVHRSNFRAQWVRKIGTPAGRQDSASALGTSARACTSSSRVRESGRSSGAGPRRPMHHHCRCLLPYVFLATALAD